MAGFGRVTNCARWSGPKLCPNDHVGTGLVVHTDDRSGGGENAEQIVGLRLICRSVGVR